MKRYTSQLYQKLGQVVFLTFRSQPGVRGETNQWVRNLEYRRTLANLLRETPAIEGYEKTSSILMGQGLGRIQDFPSLESSLPIRELPSIRVAAVKSKVSETICDFLRSKELNIEMVWVGQFNDLYKGEAFKTNAFIGWNDFNGYDPYVSFYNALNPDRPLFFDDGNFRNELQEIQNIENENEKDAAYKRFHFSLLEEVAAIPVFSHWQDFFFTREANLRYLKGFALWTMRKD